MTPFEPVAIHTGTGIGHAKKLGANPMANCARIGARPCTNPLSSKTHGSHLGTQLGNSFALKCDEFHKICRIAFRPGGSTSSSCRYK